MQECQKNIPDNKVYKYVFTFLFLKTMTNMRRKPSHDISIAVIQIVQLVNQQTFNRF